jgi:SNF2 family DNA or RNA helicase
MVTKIPSSTVVPLTGTGKKRLDALKRATSDSIFITNYETLLVPDFLEYCGEHPFSVVAADELHMAKNPTAKRSKALYSLGDTAKYRFGLTGTPILNSPMDVFGIMRFLDRGRRFGKSWFSFRAEYFKDKNAGMPKQQYFPDWVPLESQMPRLSAKLSECTMHVKKSECLDLPPLVRKTVEVSMTKEQADAYRDMKADFLAFINGKAAVANLALTKALRLLQITSGFVSVESETGESSHHVFKNTPREEALRGLLESLTACHKVIVWAIFKENFKTIRRVCDLLGLNAVEVHGDISAKEKNNAVESFNTDPDCRVFIGHPASGGIGINLVVSSYTVYWSRGFSLGDDIQSEARNYRGGSEIHERVTRIDLVTPDTLDQAVLLRLAQKQEIGAAVLGSMV